MKKTLLLAILLPVACLAQQMQSDSGRFLYAEGIRQINGIGIASNPIKAYQLFKESATAGNAQAMNALGNLYATGTGTTGDINTAIAWYKSAAQKGYSRAYYNLGMLYQKGDLVSQNFTQAALYYQQGVNAGDLLSKNLLAYLHFKGFGVAQDYHKAFKLYKELAELGEMNAQYFLGTMYRNGYGTPSDKEQARYWLEQAAAKNYQQAIHELTSEPMPENTSIITPALQQKLTTLRSYQENFITTTATDLSGTYTGYAVYYDFSKTYVHEIVPLTFRIKRNENYYEGIWTESDSLSASFKGYFNGNTFSFDSSSQYTRHNYYSYHVAEPYRFDKAMLGIKYMGDSMYLNGDVQFYSIGRKEPGQPMYISLSRKIDVGPNQAAKLKLSVTPNPASSFVQVQFTLTEAEKIQLRVFSGDGRLLQKTMPESLPAGTYIRQFNVEDFSAGSYVIQAFVHNAPAAGEGKIFIKL